MSKQVENYSLEELLETHSFSQVYTGRCFITQRRFLVRVTHLKEVAKIDNGKSLMDEILAESALLQSLRHSNIHCCQEVIFDPTAEALYWIQGYHVGSSLAQLLSQHRGLNELTAKYYFFQLVNGLLYLHCRGVAHCNLSLHSIVINQDGLLKITGFSYAWIGDQSIKYSRPEASHTAAASAAAAMDSSADEKDRIFYLSPELLIANGAVSVDRKKVDVWHCGVILYALLCGYYPFSYERGDLSAFFRSIEQGRMNPVPSTVSKLPEAVNLISRLLERTAEDRYSVSHIIFHPWLFEFVTERRGYFEGILEKYSSSVEDAVIVQSVRGSVARNSRRESLSSPPTAPTPAEPVTISPFKVMSSYLTSIGLFTAEKTSPTKPSMTAGEETDEHVGVSSPAEAHIVDDYFPPH